MLHEYIRQGLTLSALCYALGYAAGLTAFVLMARARGLATEGVMLLAGAGVIGGLVGAHIGQALAGGWEEAGGKSILGAIVGGWLAVTVVKRHIGLRRPTGDLFAVALCAGEAVGRWGCFFGGCCYGVPSGVPWAVWQHGAWRHPTQAYSSLAAFVILAVLWRYAQNKPPENALFYAQGFLMCAARFAIEFWRAGHGVYAGLSAAQWACLAGMLFFGGRWVLLTRRVEAAHACVS